LHAQLDGGEAPRDELGGLPRSNATLVESRQPVLARRDPEPPEAVFIQRAHVVARQPIAFRERSQPAILQAYQPARGAEPQTAVT
jgi:hypothetical protein